MVKTAEQIAAQEIFTVAAAVLYLKSIGLEDATPWSINQKIREGKLRTIRVGRKFKVFKADLHAMVEKSATRARA
jgi:hypothetical protein